MSGVTSALVVEDDDELAAALCSFLEREGRAKNIRRAATRAQAEQHARATQFDAALIDLTLPDGSAVGFLEALCAQPGMPRVLVISGSATPGTAFRLAQLGVKGFIPKPLRLAELERSWEDALHCPPDLRPLIRASVGSVRLLALEEAVRQSMIEEALAMAGGSRRRASSLLGISRQLLQHILRLRE